jgi:hypothetical protein
VLEILFLIWFCKKLAGIARAKNRSGNWGALGALGWVGGEIGGLALGFSANSGDFGVAYLYALLGAVGGALAAYVIVATRPKLPDNPDFPTARVV